MKTNIRCCPYESPKPVGTPALLRWPLLVVAILVYTGCVSSPDVEQLASYGRFTAYSDGTVKDSVSRLMWAARDSSFDMNMNDAKRYCENYRGGGYSDWRIPTLKELHDLYRSGIRRESEMPGQFISIHWRVWASDRIYFDSGVFSVGAYSFKIGDRHWVDPSTRQYLRALPVREF